MLTTNKVYACYAVKLYKKQTQQVFQTGWRAPSEPFLDPPLNTDSRCNNIDIASDLGFPRFVLR